MSDWKVLMEQANVKWIEKQKDKFPIRIDVDLGLWTKPPLEAVNALDIPFGSVGLPISNLAVFLFKTQADAEKFKEAFGL